MNKSFLQGSHNFDNWIRFLKKSFYNADKLIYDISNFNFIFLFNILFFIILFISQACKSVLKFTQISWFYMTMGTLKAWIWKEEKERSGINQINLWCNISLAAEYFKKHHGDCLEIYSISFSSVEAKWHLLLLMHYLMQRNALQWRYGCWIA